jgi:hypothetical protein
MAGVVKFTATKLVGTGKKGVLKPDADGYYEMVIGGLNTFNSAGEYYTLEGARALFEESSAFMRRVKNGCLKGEVGHPKRVPGMTMDQYVGRILSLDETNICCHFADIWLDPSYGQKNPQMNNSKLVAIVARLKPVGVRGEALRQALENGPENVCFSIRALTKDYFERGQTFRVLNQIVTWDWVTEPGIANATKYHSPALEDLEEQQILRSAIERVAHSHGSGLAIESSRALALECLDSFETQEKNPVKSVLMKW